MSYGISLKLDRMSIIIYPAQIDIWLDPDTHDAVILKPLLRSWDEDEIEYYPVSRQVNNRKNAGIELIQRVSI